MAFYASGRPWGDILPRYAFLEPLFTGKRVLEVGCGDGIGAAYLLERGAEQVVGVDEQADALASALADGPREGLSFKAFDGRKLEFASASFDLIIAFDLAGRMDPALLTEIERVLRPAGYLITALMNPNHLSLGQFSSQGQRSSPVAFERFIAGLQDRFARVSVFGQTPFLGFSIGWMGADSQDLPLEMDSALLPDGSEDVAFYLAICGREPVSFESQSLVQLPWAPLMEELARTDVALPAVPAGGAQPGLDESERTQWQRQVSELDRKLHIVRRQMNEYQAALAQARVALAEAAAELEHAHQAVEEQSRLARQAEQGRKDLADRLNLIEGRLADGDRETEALRQELVRKERAVERLRADQQELQQDNLVVRRDLLGQLLGLEPQTPVTHDDLPRLFFDALDAREKSLAALGSLTDAIEGLKQEASADRDRAEALSEELDRSQAEIDRLRKQAARAGAEVLEKVSWLDASRSEQERLEGLLAESEKQLGERDTQIVRLEKRRREQARTRSDQDVLVVSLRDENEGLKRSLRLAGERDEAAREQRADLSSEVNQMQAAAQQRHAQLEDLRHQADGLRAQVATRLDDVLERDRLILDLQARVETAEVNRDALAGEVDAASARAGALDEKIELAAKRQTLFEREAEVLQSELADREEELRQLRRRLTEETGERTKVELSLSEQVARNKDLESDLVELVNRLEAGQERDLDRVRSIGELDRWAGQQGTALDEAREKIDELTRELYSARRQEEDLTAAIDLMRSAVVEQEQARLELEDELENLRLGESNAERELQTERDAAQADLASARRLLEDRTAGLERAERAVDRLRVESNHHRRELDQLHERLAEARDRLAVTEAARERVIDLERELTWQRQERERLVGELESSGEELERVGSDAEQLSDDLHLAQQGRSELSDQQHETTRVLSELEDELERKQRQQTEEQARLGDALEQVDRLQAAANEGAARIEAFQRQIAERESDLEEARRRLEDEQSHGRGGQDELEQLHREFESRLGPMQQELEMAAEREHTLQDRLANLQTQLGEHKEQTGLELASLGEQIRRREEQMQSLTERLADVDNKRVWWEERANSLEEVRRQAEEKAQDLASRLTDMAQLRQLAEHQKAQADQQLIEVQQRADQAESRVLETQPDTSTRDAEVARMDAELGGARRRVGELEGEINRMRAQWEEQQQTLRRDLADLRQSVLERDARIKQLEGGCRTKLALKPTDPTSKPGE